MNIRSIKTHPITTKDSDIFRVLDDYLPILKEGDIVAITSKIIAITEGRIVPSGDIDKYTLIQQEADEYLDVPNPYGVVLTIKNGLLVASAGIDESNADNHYVLWPDDAQTSANQIRSYLCTKFKIQNLGVIITDSVTRPLRWGVTGISIAHSGFQSLRDYRGKPDIFGRPLHFTQSNIADGLAATAVLVMGEGDECTPLAILSSVDFVEFTDFDPTEMELRTQQISREEDIYGALLENEHWRKTKK